MPERADAMPHQGAIRRPVDVVAVVATEGRVQRIAGCSDLYDDGDKAFVSLDVVGTRASGYDRGSATHYVAEVTDRLIQVYDYGLSSWFAYEVQVVGEGAFANT